MSAPGKLTSQSVAGRSGHVRSRRGRAERTRSLNQSVRKSGEPAGTHSRISKQGGLGRGHPGRGRPRRQPNPPQAPLGFCERVYAAGDGRSPPWPRPANCWRLLAHDPRPTTLERMFMPGRRWSPRRPQRSSWARTPAHRGRPGRCALELQNSPGPRRALKGGSYRVNDRDPGGESPTTTPGTRGPISFWWKEVNFQAVLTGSRTVPSRLRFDMPR